MIFRDKIEDKADTSHHQLRNDDQSLARIKNQSEKRQSDPDTSHYKVYGLSLFLYLISVISHNLSSPIVM